VFVEGVFGLQVLRMAYLAAVAAASGGQLITRRLTNGHSRVVLLSPSPAQVGKHPRLPYGRPRRTDMLRADNRLLDGPLFFCGHRLGGADRDDLHTLRAVIETPAQCAESATVAAEGRRVTTGAHLA